MAFRFGWAVFQQAPGPLAVTVVVSYVVFFAVVAVLVLGVAGLVSVNAPLPVVVLAAVVAYLLLTLVGQLPTLWLLRAGTDAVDGRPLTFRRIADPAVLGRAAAAFGLVVAGSLLGLVLLVVPGIVFATMAAFTLHFVLDDQLGPKDAVRASIELFRRRPGPSLGLFFIPALVGGLGVYLCGIGLVVSLPVAMIAQMHGFRQLTGGPVPPAPAA